MSDDFPLLTKAEFYRIIARQMDVNLSMARAIVAVAGGITADQSDEYLNGMLRDIEAEMAAIAAVYGDDTESAS